MGELLAERAGEITGLSVGQQCSATLSFRRDKMEVKDSYGVVNTDQVNVVAPLRRTTSPAGHRKSRTRTHTTTTTTPHLLQRGKAKKIYIFKSLRREAEALVEYQRGSPEIVPV